MAKQRYAIITLGYRDLLVTAEQALEIAAMLDGQQTVTREYGLPGGSVYVRDDKMCTRIDIMGTDEVVLTREDYELQKAEAAEEGYA